MNADQRRHEPLPVKLWNDKGIGGDGQVLQFGGLTQGPGQVRQHRRSPRRCLDAGGSWERGDVRFLSGQDAFDAAASAVGKTCGRKCRVIKRVEDSGVIDNLDLLLTQEQVEELSIGLKRAYGNRVREGTDGECGSTNRDQTAAIRAARGDHRLFPPYTGGQVSIQPPSTRYVPPVQ